MMVSVSGVRSICMEEEFLATMMRRARTCFNGIVKERSFGFAAAGDEYLFHLFQCILHITNMTVDRDCVSTRWQFSLRPITKTVPSV